MICPKCHKDNPTINLHCDFCSEELPLSKERKEIVLKHKKVLRQDKWQKNKRYISRNVNCYHDNNHNYCGQSVRLVLVSE